MTTLRLEHLTAHLRALALAAHPSGGLEGRTNAEAARALCCPVGTIDSRLHAARARLRIRLVRRGVGPDALTGLAPASAVPPALSAAALALADAAAPTALLDRLATEAANAVALGGKTLALASLLGLSLALTAIWAVMTSTLSPEGPPLAPAAPRPGAALLAHIGSPEFRHPGAVLILGISANGRSLYTTDPAPNKDAECHFYAWDTATGRLQARHSLRGAGRGISASGFGDGSVRVVEQGEDYLYRLRVIDPVTGETVHREAGWTWPVTAFGLGSHVEFYSFTADAGWLVRSSRVGYHLLDTTSGKETRIDTASRGANGVVDGGRLFYLRDENRIRLFELPDGKEAAVVAAVGQEQHPVGITPNGKHLLLWVWHGPTWSLDAYDLATRSRRTILDQRELPGQVQFSPDGRRFALLPRAIGAHYPAGDWEVRDFPTGKEIGRVPASGVWGALFSPDGRTLFTQPGENQFVPWDAATGRPTAAAPSVLGPVERFRFTADGKLVGLAGGYVTTWDATGTKQLGRERVPAPIDRHGAVAFDAAGRRLHWTGFGDKLVVWDWEKGALHESPLGLRRPPNERVEHWLTPDGSRHIEHRVNELIILRDPATGKVTHQFRLPGAWQPHGSVNGFALSRDGRRAVLGGDNSHARPLPSCQLPPTPVAIVDLDGKADPVVVEADGTVAAVELSPDGRFLVATHREKPAPELAVWLASTSRRVATVPLGAGNPDLVHRVNAVRFSPDGRTVAVSVSHHQVVLVETATWQVRARVSEPTLESNIYYGTDRTRDVVAWSPDGRRLVTATVEGGLHLWDVRRIAATVEKPEAALAGADAIAAFAAIRTLAERPERSVPWLAATLPPAAVPTAGRLAALFADLDHEDFEQRERATAELARFGPMAEAGLRQTLRATASAEVRRRAGDLLDRLTAGVLSPEEVLATRAVEAAEWAGTPEATLLLRRWAGGAAGARLTREAQAALDRHAGR